MTTENHILIKLTVKSILFLLALLVFTGGIHEIAHLVAARAMGVAIASFTLFDSHYLAPTLITADTASELEQAAVGCAGGFVAGLTLIGIVGVKHKWFKASFLRWLAGLWMLTCGASQLSVGFLEGLANDAYLASATDLFSWASLVMLAGGLLGAVIYMIWSPEGLRRDGFSSPDNRDILHTSNV